MSAEIIKLLRKTPIFSTFDSASLKKICGFFKEKTYSSDKTLFKEGTLGDTLFVIKEGAVKISRAAKEREEEKSRTLRREGDIFGESGFLDESPRPATAQATKATKVFQLSRSNFLTILNNHPLIAYQIVKVLSSRIKQSDLRLIDELKEKNEQLHQTYRSLQEKVGATGSQESSEESQVPTEEKENLSKRLLSSVPYPLICTGEDDLISLFSKAAEEEFGYSSEEVMGKPLNMLWANNFWSFLAEGILEELQRKGMWEGEIIAGKKNGEQFLSSVTITGLRDEQGTGGGKLYLIKNVTQNKSREEDERMQERLAFRRTTAEQIANIMITEIKKLSVAFETLPLELDEVSLGRSARTMSIIRTALQNMRSLVSGLTASPAPPARKEPLDLVNLIQEELLLLKSQERFRDVIFATHFHDAAPKVSGDKCQMRQMLYAILENAAHALHQAPDGIKTITIEVSGINQEQEMQVQISDNGTGIRASDLSKVFKERFTTKRDGLGLGLLWVGETVKEHGGSVEVYSDEGTYTLFVMKFPAFEETAKEEARAEPAIKAEF
ncbi:MAG: cyclic nucleotide-binding domain-containing protein [Candidatus Zixiibacteriota bacterium]